MVGEYGKKEKTYYWSDLEEKNKEMIKEILLLRSEGNSTLTIASWLGLSRRQVFRYIAKAKLNRKIEGK